MKERSIWKVLGVGLAFLGLGGCMESLSHEPDTVSTAKEAQETQAKPAEATQANQQSQASEKSPVDINHPPEISVFDQVAIDELPVGTTLEFTSDWEIPANTSSSYRTYDPEAESTSNGCTARVGLEYKTADSRRVIRRKTVLHITGIKAMDFYTVTYDTDGPSELRLSVYRNMSNGDENSNCPRIRVRASMFAIATNGALKVTRIPEAKTF